MAGSFSLDPTGLFGSGGGIFGALSGSSDVYGTKPKPVNPPTASDITKTVAGANLAALPTLEDIAGQVNTFNLGQRQNALQTSIPGWQNLTNTESSVLSDRLQGKLPVGDAALAGAVSAARAASGGYAGSGAGLNLSARDLGLLETNVQEQAIKDVPTYLSHIGSLAMPPEFDMTHGFISPSYNPYAQYGADIYASQVAAAPDPGKAGSAAAQLGLLESLLSVAGGGGGGGGSRGIPSYSAPMAPNDYMAPYNAAPNQGWDFSPPQSNSLDLSLYA